MNHRQSVREGRLSWASSRARRRFPLVRAGSPPTSATVDAVDNRIVRALQLAPRAAFAEIASAVGVSEQTVARRYRRLRADGVLRVVGAVNPRALGQQDWLLRVQCRPDGTASLAEALARREDVAWVSVSAGGCEIVCAFRARTEQDRDELLVQRLPRTAPVLAVSASVVLHHFVGGGSPTDWVGLADALTGRQARLLPARPAPAAVGTGGTGQATRLEPGDHALLDALNRDGRTSTRVLARTTGTSEGRVARRVAALQASGVLYFDVDLAGPVFGYPTNAYLWLTVSPARLAAVGEALTGHHEVAFAAAVTGPANMVASVVCRGLDELYSYVTTKIGAIDGVRSVEISPVLRRLKQAGALLDGDRLVDPAPPARRPR